MSARLRPLVGRGAVAIFAVVALLSIASLALAAIHPRAGAYKGATNQGKQVKFKVVAERVTNPQFTIRSGICTGTFYMYTSDKVDDQGRFSLSDGTNEFRGRFVSRTKAKGTATAEFQSCPGGTKTVGFTAKRQ
jgi:hypothetical protein